MLANPDEVKAQGDINYNVDDTVIGACIRTSQNIYLRDVIGTALLEKMQELVYNAIQGSGSSIDDEANVAYKTLLDDYVVPAITYKTASDLCSRLTYKLRNFGEVKDNSINIQSATLEEVIYMKGVYDTYYNDALNRLTEFICANEAAFPESNMKCNCGGNPKYARTNLWLGK